ncbi:hypothetical protein BOTBODRAFT_27560 [Botryobasidium botryosum FD-172 SS1]|uniref:DNA mismatch repair protein MSH3 n=1 Tax=Botryobasidium botryosum (strain FD-172 SS1) TaxID=930990 RepID=A0A067N7N4_BOTB1|nr:hypothetical protein BOTBODRAFT_27560 [Botryobasidium botryosum FD-172 SS1]
MAPKPSKGKATPSAQPTISAFFSKSSQARVPKRPATPIDLTSVDSENESREVSPPPKKKLKASKDAATLSGKEPIGVKEKSKPDKNRHSTSSLSKAAATSSSSALTQFQFGSTSNPSSVAASAEKSGNGALSGSRKVDDALRRAFREKLLVKPLPILPPASEPEEGREREEGSEGDQDQEDDADDTASAGVAKLRGKFKLGAAPRAGTKAGKGKERASDAVGPSGQKYTPLEKQIVQLKRDHPGVLLLVEVGYKYRFFGEDARIASQELGIACWQDRNFLTGSIPVHRRPVHVKKLISRGHKVGVVGQTETAALKKASDNKSAPFGRKLTHLYTAATYVDDLDSADDISGSYSSPLVCIVEQLRGGMGVDELVLLGMIAVIPATGEVTYDEFEDSNMRTELETRMTHINPAELLLPEKKLSKFTEKMLAHFAEEARSTRIRIERFNDRMDYSDAFSFVSTFYTSHDEDSDTTSENLKSGKLMASLVDFPNLVIIALAHAIKYLREFDLDSAFYRTNYFSKFTTKTHMLLNGNTLSNLEIYRNQTDFTEKGSLIWVLDHTKTKFGSRLLRSWVGRPLIDMAILQGRLDAVEEILCSQSNALEKLRGLLKGLPDLSKGLCRVQYGKCTPRELATLLTAFERIASTFEPFENPSQTGFTTSLLRDIVTSLPTVREPIVQLLQDIDLGKARKEVKDELWKDVKKYPEIERAKQGIIAIEVELDAQLKEIRRILNKPTAAWVTVSGIEYMIEVRNNDRKRVPASWLKISSTKAVTRFHTPEVKAKLQQREQYKETLAAEANKAYLAFLTNDVSNHYSVFRNVIGRLAVADCLLSLAAVAVQPGYVKPEFTEADQLDITDGRHPMSEVLRSDPFVPNTVVLGGEEPRTNIITGPNMGGKSSCVRMTALLAVMAQIGSYVPARSAKLGLQEGILTRMGASDDLARGRSTFMVELAETSSILKNASPRTLVILDELGRGTSTFDGMAIAHAVLEHLVNTIRCKTLFITHYPLLATELEKNPEIANVHMGFMENSSSADGVRSIRFLYRLTLGMASGSFGIECARLAGLSERILRNAQVRSAMMQKQVEGQQEANRVRRCLRLLGACLSVGGGGAEAEAAKSIVDLLALAKAG